MIRKLLNGKFLNDRPTESVTAAAFIIAFSGVVSRILGLFRDRMLASHFGAGETLDVYYAAFRIPDLIYNLLVLGALSAAFIPVFTSLTAQKKESEAWKAAAGILNLTVLVISGISLLLAIAAPWVMHLVTPGFSEENMRSVVMLSRIMFLSPLLLGVSAVFGGVLVSLKKFLLYSIAPILYNVGIISGVIFFVPAWGPVGLAWGVVLGAALHALIQYPEVRRSGFRFAFTLFDSCRTSEVKQVLMLMMPRALSIAVTQINLLVITIFASTLRSGSLSVFNFANNIQSAPLGLFGVSFAIAAFPSLSALAAQDDKGAFAKLFSQAVRQILFFVVPISVLILVLRAQIVRVILGAGEFSWENTEMTLGVLGVLSISLFAQSLIPIFTRAFYAFHNTRTPFYIAFFGEIVNISLVLILIGRYEVMGLAIAFSVASIFSIILLFVALRKRVGDLDDKGTSTFILKILVASLLAGAAAQLSKAAIGLQFSPDTFPEVLLWLMVSVLLGVAVFSFACVFLRIDEFYKLRDAITRKIFRARDQIKEDASEVSGL